MIDLPIINKIKYNIIMVMVNWLSKISHFVLLCFGKGKVFMEFVVKFLFNHVFKLYGLPKEIVSDRNCCFTSDIAY